MFGFLTGANKQKKLQKAYEAKLGEAMQAQRKGDIRSYSTLSEQADTLLKQIESLKSSS
jgi:hypothetical protein